MSTPLDMICAAARAVVTEDIAEAMGYECGLTGANENNCAFQLFATPQLTAAWERGKAQADAERVAHPEEPER